MNKFSSLLLAAAVFAAFTQPVSAGEREKALAAEIGSALVSQLSPDSVSVVVSGEGTQAWVEVKGAMISKTRMESMKLRATLKNVPEDGAAGYGSRLSEFIASSYGEAALAESDVNDYFSSGADSGGFSNLRFDFRPEGFAASGVYKAEFLFNLQIALDADGILGLREDGVYLENVSVAVQGVKQPDNVTQLIIGKINPLLSFKDIPFPVEFSRITMSASHVVMTSDPKPLTDGERWSWHKQDKRQ